MAKPLKQNPNYIVDRTEGKLVSKEFLSAEEVDYDILTLDNLARSISETIQACKSGRLAPDRASSIGNLVKLQYKLIQDIEARNPGISAERLAKMTDTELQAEMKKLKVVDGAS